MTTVEQNATIPVDRDQIWDALADFGSIAVWAPNVDHSCLLSDQTEGVGTVRRIQTGRTTVVETVQQWEPGETLSYTIIGLPPVVRSVTNTWQLVADGDGTKVSLVTHVDAGPRPPQRGVARLIARKLGLVSAEMLAGLTTHVERTSS